MLLTVSTLQTQLLPELAKCNQIYNANKSPEELDADAWLWAEALADCDFTDDGHLRRAFILNRKTARYYPVPADIIELLPECVRGAQARKPIGEGGGGRTPGYPQALNALRKSGRYSYGALARMTVSEVFDALNELNIHEQAKKQNASVNDIIADIAGSKKC